MKISITGANGFLGRHFIRKALEAGHNVSALVGPGDNPFRENQQLKLVVGDLANQNGEAQKLLEDTEVFIHMAALGVQSRDRDWTRMIAVNCQYPLQWLETAKQVGVCKVIAIGTALEYEGFGDLPGIDPYPDGNYPLCDENSSLECTDPYGATKAAGGILLRSYARSIDMPLIYLRLASMYGHGDDLKKLIPSAVYAATNKLSFPMSQGEQVRDWLHVDDAVAAIFASISCVDKKSSIFNIGTNKGVAVAELIQQIFNQLGASESLLDPSAYTYRKNEKRYLVLDSSQAMQTFQWAITHDIMNERWN